MLSFFLGNVQAIVFLHCDRIKLAKISDIITSSISENIFDMFVAVRSLIKGKLTMDAWNIPWNMQTLYHFCFTFVFCYDVYNKLWFLKQHMLCAMLIITFYCDLMRKYISVMIHAWLNILQLFVICCSVLCLGNWWHLWRIKRYSKAHVYRLVFRANILHDTHMRDPGDMNSYNRVFIMHPPLRTESIMTTAFTTNRWNMLFA